MPPPNNLAHTPLLVCVCLCGLRIWWGNLVNAWSVIIMWKWSVNQSARLCPVQCLVSFKANQQRTPLMANDIPDSDQYIVLRSRTKHLNNVKCLGMLNEKIRNKYVRNNEHVKFHSNSHWASPVEHGKFYILKSAQWVSELSEFLFNGASADIGH